MTQEEQKLTDFIHHNLPLMVNARVKIHHYDSAIFTLSMPLDANYNDKATAFGGSLYCLCVTNAIGLAFLKAYERGIEPDLVVSSANIQYLKPVSDNLILASTAELEPSCWQSFFDDYKKHGKARITIRSSITQGGEIAVTFEGQFAIIGKK